MKKLALLISLLTIIACDKESNDFPKTYSFSSFETGKVRVFTNNGEIEDEQLSNGFINSWSDYFYKEDSFRFEDFNFNGEITLNTNNQTTVQASDSVMYFEFKQKDGVIYFESSDTAYSVNLEDKRFRYGPITQTGIKQGPPIGLSPIFSYYYGYLPCVYALDNGSEIKFPFISFLEKNCTDDTQWIMGDCYNINAISNINN